MNRQRWSAQGTCQRLHVPGQRDIRTLEQAARTIEDWIEAQAATETELVDDADELRQVGALARAGAPEHEVNWAVRRARQHGWGWAPIALLLGETREQARQRLA
jgi:hypothetical protein